MIHRLPRWVLADKFPALYSDESLTAVEMVGRIYRKMQDLIDDYNKFVTSLEDLMELYTSSTNKDIEDFKLEVRTMFQDFVDAVDIKISDQDKDIKEAIEFMKNNIGASITVLLNQMEQDGTLNEAILNALRSSMLVEVSLDENENLHITNALVDVVQYDEVNEAITIAEGDFGSKEDKINKVTEITPSASDTEYPSAQAVYEFVNGNITEALGGEY